MEPTFDIPTETLANRQEFTARLFSGLELKAARNPLTIAGVRKDYLFPTLYADVRCAQGIFHCSFDAAKAVLREALGPDAMPPRMLGGRSIVAVSCYEYRRVLGLRPYNEIAIAIPLRLDGTSGPTLLGAFAGGPDSGYYIACMPVTSDENRMRGHYFWNLPKISRRIDVSEAGGLCRFDSYGEGRELDISLSVPIVGKKKAMSVRSFLATRQDGKIARNPTAFEGDFAINLDAATILGAKRGAQALTLGKGEASEILRRIKAETRALQTRFASSMSSYFDLAPGAHEGD